MTEQQIYDTVKAALLKQGKRSVRTDEGGIGCAYRGQGGSKCAAGWLVKDEIYTPESEGGGICAHSWLDDESAIAEQMIVDSGVPPQYLPLVAELQELHDGFDPCDWSESLTALAIKWGLKP